MRFRPIVLRFALLLLPVWVLACTDRCESSVARAQRYVERRVAETRSDVPRVRLLVSFRDDFNRGRIWAPEDVVALLRDHPEAYLYVGSFSPGYPAGSPVLASVGKRVNRWQAAIAEYNRSHDPDLDPGRLCVDWRPDLVFKHIDGGRGEENCFRLLDAPQCAPSPCWKHYPDNPCARWEGDMGRHWGPSGVFRTEWLMRTPARTWDAMVFKYFGGVDFCTPEVHDWYHGGMDRLATCGANTAEGKVVLYTEVDAARRRIKNQSGVLLDLRNPEAREWNARYLISHIASLGIDPGESACVLVAYKPGIWVHYDGPGAGHDCPADEANSWSGFVTPRNATTCPAPRNVVPTPYGPGEFERAMNEQMRVAFRLLDAPAPAPLQPDGRGELNYSRIRFLFTERPDLQGQLWKIWDGDIRTSARVLGEMDNRPTGLSPTR